MGGAVLGQQRESFYKVPCPLLRFTTAARWFFFGSIADTQGTPNFGKP